MVSPFGSCTKLQNKTIYMYKVIHASSNCELKLACIIWKQCFWIAYIYIYIYIYMFFCMNNVCQLCLGHGC